MGIEKDPKKVVSLYCMEKVCLYTLHTEREMVPLKFLCVYREGLFIEGLCVPVPTGLKMDL